MEKKKLEIDIPEGKAPKMTTSENGVHVEWVPKEKTWEQYVEEYKKYLNSCYGTSFIEEVTHWPKLFKFGLLQYIADDLNEEKIDWENEDQGKNEVVYDHEYQSVGIATVVCAHAPTVHFTDQAIDRAREIIPAGFLKTF